MMYDGILAGVIGPWQVVLIGLVVLFLAVAAIVRALRRKGE